MRLVDAISVTARGDALFASQVSAGQARLASIAGRHGRAQTFTVTRFRGPRRPPPAPWSAPGRPSR